MKRMARRNRISGQWAARSIEMLESPAYRVLSLSAHRALARIEIELAHHGGQDNGQLPVTFDDFVAYGLHRTAIGPALLELEALGFIRITERGRMAKAAEYRRPNLFLLMSRPPQKGSEAPSEWRRFKTIEEAEAAVAAVRKDAKRKNRQYGKRTDRQYGKRTDEGRKPSTDSVPLQMSESVPLSISRDIGPACMGDARPTDEDGSGSTIALSLTAAARVAGLSEATLKAAIASGRLKAARRPDRRILGDPEGAYLIDPIDLAAFAPKRRLAGQASGLICAHCGELFSAKRRGARFCREGCQQLAWKRRKRARANGGVPRPRGRPRKMDLRLVEGGLHHA